MRTSGQENSEKNKRNIKNNGKYDNNINNTKEKYDKKSNDTHIK